MPEIDPDQAAERVKKLIIVGDNRLKQGGDDKYAKARGTFEQALRLAEEAGIDERFRPFIERRLESVDELGPGGGSYDLRPSSSASSARSGGPAHRCTTSPLLSTYSTVGTARPWAPARPCSSITIASVWCTATVAARRLRETRQAGLAGAEYCTNAPRAGNSAARRRPDRAGRPAVTTVCACARQRSARRPRRAR